MHNCSTSLPGVKNDVFCAITRAWELKEFRLTASIRTQAYINAQNKQLKAKMADTINGTGWGL